jgi:hypothetical protein
VDEFGNLPPVAELSVHWVQVEVGCVSLLELGLMNMISMRMILKNFLAFYFKNY